MALEKVDLRQYPRPGGILNLWPLKTVDLQKKNSENRLQNGSDVRKRRANDRYQLCVQAQRSGRTLDA